MITVFNRVLRRKGGVLSPNSVQMRGKMIFFFKMKVADEIRTKKQSIVGKMQGTEKPMRSEVPGACKSLDSNGA